MELIDYIIKLSYAFTLHYISPTVFYYWYLPFVNDINNILY